MSWNEAAMMSLSNFEQAYACSLFASVHLCSYVY
jgi:hypothetical protein